MISRLLLSIGRADSAPPPRAKVSSGLATSSSDFDPRPAFDPRFAPDVVNVRWLTALLLLASGAALMLDGVWTSLSPGLLGAAAPELYQRAATGSDLQRADRLASAEHRDGRDLIRTRIEQLTDDGHGTKSFTHVMLRLVPASLRPQPPDFPNDERVAKKTPGAAIAAAAGRASTQISALSGALPAEIRFGTSLPPPPSHASSFAADETSPSPIPLGVPINLSVIAKSAGTFGAERRVILARAGDTLNGILAALGVTAQDAGAIADVLKPRTWFGRATLAGGETITVLQDRARDHQRPWQVSIERDGKPQRVAVLSDAGLYVPAPLRPRTATVAPADTHDALALRVSLDAAQSGVKLRESLRLLAQEKRVAPSVVADVVRLCAKDIDLEAAISALDTAEFLYDRSGEDRELAFAALTLDGHTHRYYRFTAPDDGSTDYYDADGRSVTASLIHNPVADGRLGDGFGWRIHPILRDRRFHEGVDYAAPFGSPIEAAGAGVVEKIDEEAGYGRYVRIRHDFGYETTYAHISGMPRGLKVGMRVHPGQTIAYIGSTGLSTGPHLYYELRVNGHYADPLRTHLRAGRVLEGDTLAIFQGVRARIDMLLQASARTADAGR